MGFNVLDSAGNLRDLGSVMEEIGNGWKDLSREQQISLAQTMAGTRQYNNLIALFDNWDMYLKSLNVSMSANGTLQQQQNIYLESSAAHLKQVSTAWENVYDSMLDPSAINIISDLLAGLGDITANWIDSLGGGIGTLNVLGTTATRVFSKQIASGLNTFISNFTRAKDQANAITAIMGGYQNQYANLGANATDPNAQFYQNVARTAQFNTNMTPEQQQAVKAHLDEMAALTDKKAAYEEATKSAEVYYQKILNTSKSIEEITDDEFDLIDHLKDNYAEVMTLQDEMQKPSEGLFYGKDDSDKYYEDTKKYGQDIRKLVKNYKEIQDKVSDKLKKEIKDTFILDRAGAIENDQQLGEELFNSDKYIQASEKFKEAVSKAYKEVMGETFDVVDEVTQTIGRIGDGEGQLINEAMERSQTAFDALMNPIQRQAVIQGFVGLAGSVGQVVTGFQSLANIGNIWSDENLSDTEKLQQTFSNLATSAPMIIAGLSGAGTAITEVAKGLSLVSGANVTVLDSVKALWGAIPVLGKVAIGAAAVVGVGFAIYDFVTRSVSEIEESLEEHLGEYSKIRGEISSLETELSKCRDRLAELYLISEDDLSVVDREEIANLEALNLSLETQLALKKQLKDEESKAAIKDVVDLNNKHGFDLSKYSTPYLFMDKQEMDVATQSYNDYLRRVRENDAYSQYSGTDVERVLQAASQMTGYANNTIKAAYNKDLFNAAIRFNATGDTGSYSEDVLRQALSSYAGEITTEATQVYFDGLTKQLYELDYSDLLGYKKWQKEIATLMANNAGNEKELERLEEAVEYARSKYEPEQTKYTDDLFDFLETAEQVIPILREKTFLLPDELAALNALYKVQQEAYIATGKYESSLQQIIGHSIKDEESFNKLKENYTDYLSETNPEEFDLTKITDERLRKQAELMQNWADAYNLSVADILEYLSDNADLAFESLIKGYEGFKASILTENSDGSTSVEEVNVEPAIKDLYSSWSGEEETGQEQSYIQRAKEFQDSLKQTFIDGIFNEEAFSQIFDSDALQQIKDQAESLGIEASELIKLFISQSTNTIASSIESYSKDILLQSSKRINKMANKANSLNVASTELSEKNSLEGLTEDERADFISLLSEMTGIYDEAITAEEEWAQISKGSIWEQVKYLSDLREEYNNLHEQKINNIKAEQEATIKAEEAELKRLEAERDKEQARYDELTAKGTESSSKPEDDDYFDISNLTAEEQEEYNQLTIALEGYREKIEETSVTLEELREQFENTDWDMEFDNAQLEDLLTYGEMIIDQSEKMAEAASMIGEGYKISAKDVEEFANLMPELLREAEATSDGTIQLNEDVVKSFLAGEEEIISSDTATAIAQIDNKIKTLEAKKLAAEAELDLVQQVANGELEAEGLTIDQIAKARQNFTDYLIKLGATEEEANILASEAMAKNGAELVRVFGNDSESIANNMQKAFFVAANSSSANTSTMIGHANFLVRAFTNAWNAIRGLGASETDTGTSGGTLLGGFTKEGADGGFDRSTGVSTSALRANAMDRIRDLQIELDSYNRAIGQLNAMKLRLQGGLSGAQNAINNAGRGSGGSGGGGGGGKGGSGNKEKEAEQIDLLEDESDLYHDINIEIDQLDKHLSKLQKRQELLTGKELIDNLNEQLKILQKQRSVIADKIEMAKLEADSYRELLKESYGATFNADGQISNYYDILDKELKRVNDIITRYNNLPASKQTDEEKEKVEQAEQQYQDLLTLIEEYEQLINDSIPQLEETIQEKLREDIEIKLEQFELSIQLSLDMAEAERNWNEFKKRILENAGEDDLLANARNQYADIVSYYNTNGTGTGAVQAATARNNRILEELATLDSGGHSDIYSAFDEATGTWIDNRAQAMEDLASSNEELMQMLMDIRDLEEEVNSEFLDSIDAVQESYDVRNEAFEFLTEQIEHDITLMELLYGDRAYNKMSKYHEKQVQADRQQIANLQSQAQYWQNLMDAARKAGESEAYEMYRENWMESISSLNETIEAWAEHLANQYANTIKEIIEKLNQEISDFRGLDYINEELTLMGKNAENYLDTINAAYALQNLQNKWQDAINNNDSITTQQKLNDLMEHQMAMLERKGQLTQYDIDRAEKEYEIALKQIALQEAQQNKSKMRLRRDANGNYSYQFVSDEQSIADAQKELADLQNELYNFDKSEYQNNLNEMYSMWNDFQTKISEVMLDTNLTDEARQQKIMLLYEQYADKINYLAEKNTTIRLNLESSAFDSLANIYEMNVQEFQNMSDAERNIIMAELVPQWNSGVQEMIDKLNGSGGLAEVFNSTFEDLMNAADRYNQKQQEVGAVSTELSTNLEQQQEELTRTADEAVTAAQRELDAISQIRGEVQGLTQDYMAARQAAILASESAYTYWQEQQERARQEAETQRQEAVSGTFTPVEEGGRQQNAGGGKKPEASTTTTGTTGTSTDDGKKDNNKKSKKASQDIIKGIAAAIWCEGNNGWGNDPGRSQKLISKFNKATRDAVQNYINNHANNGDLYRYWVDKLNRNASAYHYNKFKTGGLADYTGMAWLDGTPQKPELVLNAGDTANMLSALSILDRITSTLGEGAIRTIASRLDAISGNSRFQEGVKAETIEQTVHITATFEGKTEAHEIQTALDNLINVASQRAHRKEK